MKKIFSILILTTLLVALVLPMVANAQIGGTAAQANECCKLRRAIIIGTDTIPKGTVVGSDIGGAYCSLGTATGRSNWGEICMINTIYGITDWIFFVFMAFAVIYITYGALTFVMAAGDPEKAKKGRDFIFYALIGVAIGLLARAFPSIAAGIIGL
ncbi:hypothetical protein ACFL0A_01150 [Patescibacteria group bacterium]